MMPRLSASVDVAQFGLGATTGLGGYSGGRRMTLLNPLGHWTVRTLQGLTLGAALLGTAGAVVAQRPGATQTPGAPQAPTAQVPTAQAPAAKPAALPKRIYTKSNEFKLPIQMDDKARS